MHRDRRRGVRRVLQVAEFVKLKDQMTANILYRFAPEQDQIIKHNPSISLFEDLSRHTGLSQIEITENLKQKSNILKFLIDNNLRSLKEIGKVTNLYYINKPELLEIVKKKQPEKLRETNGL